MKIEDLTLEQIKEIMKMVNITLNKEDCRGKQLQEFIGSNALLRCDRLGVQVGTVKEITEDFMVLLNARKLWEWQCKESVSLESLCINGADEKTRATKIVEITLLRLDDICGLFVLKDKIYSQIMSLESSEQD